MLRELKLANRVVALFVVDQRMPEMTGVEFLAQAIELFPDAKRVLLTAYADTEAAIRAINEVRLDHYLMKPWHPPEELLYPVLDDLLDDWRANYQPVFEGVRVIGHRWSADGHRVRDFLARNLIPYRWLDIETDAEATELRELAGAAAEPLPLVLLADGTALSRPTIAELAEKVGLHTRAVSQTYDLIVVGTGPAGLAAAVYGASEGLGRSSSSARRRADRRAPARGSRTISAFPSASAAPTWRAAPWRRRAGSAPRSCRRWRRSSSRPQDGYHVVTLSDGIDGRRRRR